METMRPEPGPTAPIIHAPQAGLAPPVARPTTTGDEMLASLTGQDPESTPDVLRGIVMSRASIDTSHSLVSELEHRLAHVLVDAEPMPPRDPGPERRTAAGQLAGNLYDETAGLEQRLRVLLGRIRGV